MRWNPVVGWIPVVTLARGSVLPLHRLPIWLNWHRRRVLTSYRARYAEYVERVRYEAFPFRTVEDDRARELRSDLEEESGRVARMTSAAGVPGRERWVPGRSTGSVERVDLVEAAFTPDEHNVNGSDVLDVLDDAIGRYRRGRWGAWLRTFNPLYWLGTLLDAAEIVPFVALRRLGVDGRAAAASVPGRIFRTGLRAAVLLGGFLAVAWALGLWGELRAMTGQLLDGVVGSGGSSSRPSVYGR